MCVYIYIYMYIYICIIYYIYILFKILVIRHLALGIVLHYIMVEVI